MLQNRVCVCHTDVTFYRQMSEEMVTTGNVK